MPQGSFEFSRLQILVSRRISPFIFGLLSTIRMLKKSIHGFFSHDLREVNSRKSFKSLDTQSSRFGGASLHRASRPRGTVFQQPARLLFLAALAALLLVVPGPVRAETDETTLFMNGYQAHLQGENDKAIATLNDVIKKYPKGKMTDLALYWLGKTYVKVGRPQDAIQAFRTLKTKHPKSAMAPLASEQLARLEKEQVAALPPSREPRAEKPPEGLAPPTRPVPERKVEPEKPAPPPPVVAKKEPIAKEPPPPAPKPPIAAKPPAVSKPPAVAKIEEPPKPPPVKEAKAPAKPAVKPPPAKKEKKEPERVVEAPVKPKPAKPKAEEPSKEEKQRAAAEHRRKAIESYEKIIQAAPDSPEAARARKRLAGLGVREKPPTPAKPAVTARKEPPLHAPQPGESVFLVVERVASVEIGGAPPGLTSIPGETVTVSFDVANKGNGDDAFVLTSTLPPAYQAAFFHDAAGTGQVRAGEPSVTETPRLAMGQKTRFLLRARLPIELLDGARQAFEIKASSKADPTVSQAAPVALTASAPSLRGVFALDRKTVKPGEAVSYTLTVQNAGSADSRLARVVVSYPGSLSLASATPPAASADPLTHMASWDLDRLAPRDRKALRLDFRVREDALADQDLVVRAVLQSAQGEPAVSVVSAAAKVESVAGVRVAGIDAPRTVFPRETIFIPFTLKNTGNGPDQFSVRAQGDAGPVSVYEDKNRDGVRQPDEPAVETTRTLNPQEEVSLLASLTVPADEPDARRQAIRVVAASKRTRSATAEAARLIVVSRPIVTIATQMASKEGVPGKVFSYQLVCTNTGTSPARRVTISESLPPELEFVDSQPRPGRVDGRRLAWEIADLGSGQKEVLTVGVRVKSGIPAGTAVRKATSVRYTDLRDQVYE